MSLNALNIVLRDLEDWINAEIHGIMLATVPGAEWPIRIERLKKDASYLISCLEILTQHKDKLKSMVSLFECISLIILATDPRISSKNDSN